MLSDAEKRIDEIAKRHARRLMSLLPKRSKYGAKSMYLDGEYFASQMEYRRYQQLLLLEKAGEIHDLQRQVRIPLVVNGELLGHYVADATYREKDGSMVVEDTKGVRTQLYNWKRRHVRAQYGAEIREVRA